MHYLTLLAATLALFQLSSAAPAPFVDENSSIFDVDMTDSTPGLHALEKRQTCTGVSRCKNKIIWQNGQRACVNGVCTTVCKPNYKYAGNKKCVGVKKTSSSSSSKKVASTKSSVKLATVASASSNLDGVPSSWLGSNGNAILSWFKANSAQDSTNGHSWCYYPYSDSLPGAAISLSTMLTAASGDATKARQMFCGLEMQVTTAAGKTATLYVADAFDDAWVLTPNSMDLLYNSFVKLFGKKTTNKNDVLQGASWKFTGNKSSKYSYASTTSLS
ncbi:hypothetical protein JCM8547_002142 [Rhodosporidiobolus lusitaniae]